MQKINILTIGKNKDLWIVESIFHYRKLLKRYCQLEILYLPDIKGARSLDPKSLKNKEAELFGRHIKSKFTIALSDSGKSFSSHQFSGFLQKASHQAGTLDFLIGGIYGLDDDLVKRCTQCISLSKMTFSHQLVRPVLLEQLYRAYNILSGGSYHK